MNASFGETLLASSIALLALMTLAGLVFAAFGYVKAKRQRGYYADLHKSLEVGQRVQFSGGLIGELVRVGGETCDVRLKSGAVAEVSRFSIQGIEA